MSRVGRRPGSPDTQAEILDAAREIFATSGYDRATIRTIAGKASVDPALIHHYFGSKERLYAASISLPMGPADAMEAVFSGDREGAGERLARTFLSIWENEQARAALLGILRSAMSGEEQAVSAFRQYIVSALQGHIAERIDHPDAELRALAIAGQMVGLAMVRYVVRIEPVASADVEELVRMIGPRLQSYLD